MSYTKLASTEEIPPGTMKSFAVSGRKILIANSEGKFFALDDKCPHLGKPMSKGILNKTCVTCPYHGAQFDLVSGDSVKEANFLFWKMHCNNAHVYDLQLVDNDIFVAV